MLLSGKTVVLGVSGSIAAYKIPTFSKTAQKAGLQCSGTHDTERHSIYKPYHF